MELKTAIRHSARRINAIAKSVGAKRYLEVGVSTGMTFFTVDIERKTGVDPAFRFDKKAVESETAKFYEMTSDEWFTQHSHGEMFDIIFLDGLHTFEQTFRDFCNSMATAHPKTIWIIDDTVPADAYAAWPQQQEAARFRREDTGRGKIGWQGDVFKTVFAIHDFFPVLSYCTIVTDGNSQTVVWRQPRQNFVPVFDNIESVSRMTYFDLKRKFDVMRPMPEEEALRLAVASYA